MVGFIFSNIFINVELYIDFPYVKHKKNVTFLPHAKDMLVG